MTPGQDQPPSRDARPLSAAENELAASRRQIADLTSELEETNRGLIAFHRELEVARQAEAQLAAIVRSSDDAMISITPDLVITTWNPGAEHLFGYTAAEMTGKSKQVLVPEPLLGEFGQLLRQVSSGQSASYDTQRQRKDGTIVDVAVTMSAIRGPGGELIGYSAVYRDITGRLAAEAELAAARAQREVLADRDRMARDLQDRVVGRLFGIGMNLQGLASRAGQPELADRITVVVTELDLAINEIRQAIFAVSGRAEPAPAKTNLRDQVLALAAEAADALGFAPHVRFTGPVGDIPPATGSQLLAVIREALSNTARHAEASAADITLTAGRDVVLVISDNGRGVGETTRRSGLGNMRDRAAALGGSFRIGGGPDTGTRIEWRVPGT